MSFFTISSLVALLSYAWAGMVGMSALWQFLMAFPAMLIGERIGLMLFRHFGNAVYRRVAIAVLLSVGVVTLAKAFA